MKIDIPRETVLKILYDINVNGAYSNISLNKHLEAGKLEERDRAFVTEMVYGTVKWQLTIDFAIRQFSSVRLRKISPWIMNILRLGAYQLLYMDKVPESAACNESANLAARYGHKASTGFVNGLLRNMSRNRQNIRYPEKKDGMVQYLSVKYSHTEWMVERFMKLFGDDFTESLLDSNNGMPDFIIRTNTLKTTRLKLLEILEKEGIEAEEGRFAAEAVMIKYPSAIVRLDAFKNGLFQVQDESSMLAAKILDPKPGEKVLDCCSAPGGKATHIAQLMENKGAVIAGDIHEHKLKLIEESASRLGIEIIKTELHDASIDDESFMGMFDRVLLDAPCTGLGIIRRKPDIKWSRESSDENEITGLQKKMIRVAAGCVKPGGILVYSTCTVLPEENSSIVNGFLEENEEFKLDDITSYLPDNLKDKVIDKGMLQLYPNRDGTDGFFMARLVRFEMEKQDLMDMEISELQNLLAAMGQQKFRAKQIFQWIAKGAREIDEMTDLSKALRDQLKLSAHIGSLKIRNKLVSKIDGTAKYLFELPDGNIIESVLMRYKHGLTVCISSQVGCKMGCKFCASTLAGYMRNLTAGEMLDQVMSIGRDSGEKIGNVVIMGIGEPFDNYDNIIKFFRLIHDPDGINMGYRHLTVSTCGLIPEILRFTRENMPVNLSISLHAPNDQIRESLMPVNRKYGIDKLIETCKIYTEETKRRLTFEYAMISGVNDSPENARELSTKLKGMLCHVNLIPANRVEGSGFDQSGRKRMEEFMGILERNGIEATVRRELGSDINAACGQLRRSELEKSQL